MPLSRLTILVLIILLGANVIAAQASGSAVAIITVYSQDEEFYLKSVPYDDEFPSLSGETSIYRKGIATPLYVFERGFDSVDEESNNLVLSNNGDVIFYAIPWGADETKEGLKSITIYKKGTIVSSFTETEINGCDIKKERCELTYSNYDEVVDKVKSRWGTSNYKKAFKEGVSEQEKFLSDFSIFSFDDTVYLTDSKKNVHLFDLKEGKYLRSEPFENFYEQIKHKGRFNRTELQNFESPVFLDFPKLQNGKDTYQSLADYIGMTAADLTEARNDRYKLYTFEMNCIISQDGSIEIENIKYYDDLPKEKIIKFFTTNKFDSSSISKVFDKWLIRNEFFSFRKRSAQLARQEKQQERIRQREELKVRMTAERIEGVYIPRDLGECFVELDKLLTEIDKKEMKALPDREDMIQYHMDIGMWMRNNWGLWGGSRLQKYFTSRGVTHPDEMSSIVLEFYYDWLNGKKETWKDWDRKPR